jgi:hypothetical protein
VTDVSDVVCPDEYHSALRVDRVHLAVLHAPSDVLHLIAADPEIQSVVRPRVVLFPELLALAVPALTAGANSRLATDRRAVEFAAENPGVLSVHMSG